MNIDNKYKYDKNVEKIDFLEYVGANLVFSYTKLHSIFTVASRDYYAYQYFNIEPNGAIYYCIFDDEKDDMPEEKGSVRIVTPLGGAAFEPMDGDPNKCTVTMYG
jgi:hypothetical protein